VGLSVFSSDGTRVGEVKSIDTGPRGDIVALHIRTGGFLGFGGRIVAIPEGRFIRSGQSIRLDLDSDQVSELPEIKN
jgi:sporulation protein YlmC with PRC-barrel domain